MKRTNVFAVLMGALLLVPCWGNAQIARYDIVQYGAVSDGKTNNAAAINRAIAAAARAGGGTVVVPPGDYMSGPINILSNVTLHLEAGSMIRGSTRLEDYWVPPAGGEAAKESAGSLAPEQGSGAPPGRTLAALITATNANNIAITGRGIIDGSALAFMNTNQVLDLNYAHRDAGYWIPSLVRQGEDFLSPKFGNQDSPFVPKPRPANMLQINHCDNVMITGVTIQNAPIGSWVTNSRYVDIIGVKINGFASNRRVPNDDGIHLTDSRFIHIAGCDIQTGDDSIALHGVEDLTVTNCTLSSHDSAIRVGDDDGEIRNCTFSNLVIFSTTRGINVYLRGTGVIENVLFDNIVIQTQLFTGYWWGKGEPIHISSVMKAGTKTTGVIRDLRFSNIIANSEGGILIYGTKDSIIRDILLDRVKLKIKAGPYTESLGGNFDLRGWVPPELTVFKHDIPGLYGGYVDGLKLSNFEVEWEGKFPSSSHMGSNAITSGTWR
ncbi:MAG TPA: glycosyl hydrolase family 28 protein [Terriglobia bacterium]|nr:glycosyl hydrolase family 28 protein [Terriglobia bacterium]